MSVLSKDFLDFATDAVKRTDEIGYRNAVARSYYAMFHEIRIMLISLPRFRANGHAGLIDYLKDPHSDEPYDRVALRELASMLKQQKGKRVTADYALDFDVSKSDALASIKTAERFFQKCQELNERCKKISG
ncbi:HEPN domain-containing protein [Aeromonas sanarellii]|uniref:HEPN domain-containing protein n=1 Tax=Aeromonas sanarellii TaxID=633415 RepID=UPI0038D062E1